MLPVNNNSLFFSDATVDIAMPSPCTSSSHSISVRAFRWRIWEKKNSLGHVTRNAFAARNNEAYGEGRQSFCTVLRYKNTGHRYFVVGRFHIRARNGLSVWDLPVCSRPLHHRHPFSDFFCGEGAAVHRLSETDSHLQTVHQNWRIKSGGLFIQK